MGANATDKFNQRAAEWPHLWFGIFREGESSPVEIPELADFKEVGWKADLRREIVRYLNGAPCVLATSAGTHSCSLCKLKLAFGNFRSDGVWLWPDKLGIWLSVTI